MQIVCLAIEFVVQTVFLTLALWVLVKLQKLQFTFLGLLGAAALSMLFDRIPFVGHYLAFTVLFLCMMKVTREDFGGIAFTIGVSYALTFGMNLWLLGAMMGDLRVSARTREPLAPALESVVVPEDVNDELSDRELTETPKPAVPQKKAAPQKKAVSLQQAAPAKEPLKQAPAPAPVKAPPPKIQGLALKGIIKGPELTMVILSAGLKTYSLCPGDSVQLETSAGTYEVILEKVKNNSVLLNIGGWQMELAR